MSDRPPDPSMIMQLATGYWPSAVLLAANEVGLFDALTAHELSSAQVCARLGLSQRGGEMLLDACAGLGLIERHQAGTGDATYRNAPPAAAYLVRGRPGYLGDAIRWSADQYAAWGALPASVRTGDPAAPPELHLGGDPEHTRRFVLGMHNRALGVARGLVPLLDLEGARDLLDLGGGPAVYAMLLAERWPALRVTVLDLPPVAEVARELIAEAGVSDRVTVRGADLLTQDYGEAEYDAVLLSGVLHQMAEGSIRSILQRAYTALRPGGRLLISDMMVDESHSQPVFSALFSLQMLLTSDEGAVFSTEECITWMRAAGFEDAAARFLPPPLPYALATGRRANRANDG